MTLLTEEDVVFKIVDKVLTQVFGGKVTSLIYKHLENRYELRPSEFAARIDVFANGLETFLSSGAHIIERKIIEDIYLCYGLTEQTEALRENQPCDFAGQVRFALQRA